jgi:hypothetical protein
VSDETIVEHVAVRELGAFSNRLRAWQREEREELR